MKTLTQSLLMVLAAFILAMVLTMPAHAVTFEQSFRGGGRIGLTEQTCPYARGGRAYSYIPGKPAALGCWIKLGGVILIRWDADREQQLAYPADSFKEAPTI